ncbi:hypothetical protein HID58_078794 [Brassica napus]|uniref:CBS domain-containing protein n=1 Tax=Brassica napus TaxID=3708 RepID=A0ABQ7YV06_BRANA|nr:hypothetical protein HID58_078794 [Brassica napus]
MDAVVHACPLSITRLRAPPSLSSPTLIPPRFLSIHSTFSPTLSSLSKSRGPSASSAGATLMAKSSSPRSGVYTVGEFMTKKDDLHVVKPTTTVDEGFPVIDQDWKLVGLVSDYDLLALDSISGKWASQHPLDAFGSGSTENAMFPEVDSTWKTFNAVQKLLSKTNGKLVGDLMTPAPVVVEENTNLEDAAKLLILLETKYRRLPVVDSDGKLVGIITRGNVVRAALQIKRTGDRNA